MSERLIPMTDRVGNLLLGEDECDEPLPGSVVFTNGEYGTCWQRWFSDGLWHRVGGGRARTWTEIVKHRNVVLVYDAPERAL